MSDGSTEARIVLTTVASQEQAEQLARALVGEQLAACASIVPSVRSIYRWQGNLEEESEAMVLLKTTSGNLAALEERLHQLHSYTTPEFLVLPVERGSEKYLGWLTESVRKG